VEGEPRGTGSARGWKQRLITACYNLHVSVVGTRACWTTSCRQWWGPYYNVLYNGNRAYYKGHYKVTLHLHVHSLQLL